MSSTFVNTDKYTIKGAQGQNMSLPVYLQFVPGVVLDVVTSDRSVAWGSTDRNINSIIAIKHLGKKVMERKGTKSEQNRYVPLLRGMVDVPVKGDPVLLCTFGGVNYYLGPLNPDNNPNFNVDHLNRREINYGIKTRNNGGRRPKNILKDHRGISPSFIPISQLSRTQKPYNAVLDSPHKHFEADIPGDVVFEGRYGNSIRIGSRNVFPYIFISNGRHISNKMESPYDHSFIGLIEFGSLRQHFDKGVIINERDDREKVTDMSYSPFLLSSDNSDLNNNRSLSSMIKFIYGGRESYDPTSVLYGYGGIDPTETEDPIPEIGSQIFLRSQRVTLDSSTDDIFLSSAGNIHMAAAQRLTISTKSETIIEANNIYLGKDSKDKKDNNETPEPLVLGEQLKLILEEMIDILESFKVTGCIGGLSGPPEPGILGKIQTLKSKIKNNTEFLSKFHYIESNDVQK